MSRSVAPPQRAPRIRRGLLGAAALMALSGVVAAPAGALHAHAASTGASSRSVLVWGDNTFGEYGDGTSVTPANSYWHPRVVPGLSNPVRVMAGNGFDLAITGDGSGEAATNQLWGWGWDDAEVLGMPADHNCTRGGGLAVACVLRPKPVRGEGGGGQLAGVIDLATNGNLTLALMAGGTVEAWGCEPAFSDGGSTGQLGNDTGVRPELDRNTGAIASYCRGYPLPVQHLSDVSGIAVGSEYAMAVRHDGTVWMWGYNAGAFGSASWVPRSSAEPVEVEKPDATGPLEGIVAVSAGHDAQPYAVQADAGGAALATVWTWGGQDRSGSLLPQRQVLDASGLPFRGLQSLAVRGGSQLGARADGTVWDWGAYVQADGTANDPRCACKPTPRRVVLGPDGDALSGARAVTGQANDTAGALMMDGSVYLWGNNTYGALARDPATTTGAMDCCWTSGSTFPLLVPSLSDAVDVSVSWTGIAIAVPPPSGTPAPAGQEHQELPPQGAAENAPASSAPPPNPPQPGMALGAKPASQAGPAGNPPAGQTAQAPAASGVSNPVIAPASGPAAAPGPGLMTGSAHVPGGAPLVGVGVRTAAPSSAAGAAEQYTMVRHRDDRVAAVVLGLTGLALAPLAMSVLAMMRTRREPLAATCIAAVQAGGSDVDVEWGQYA